ncbi:MAG: DUF2817 domain-containing protein [Pseudomonadota bacterium]
MSQYFSQSYTEGRQKFLAAARSRGVCVHSYPHPLKGPGGEALATDVAVLGDPNAPNVFFSASAVHGVEGFYGSAAQSAALFELQPPDDVRVVLIHAINPWGWSHLRRNNEDNVDLNRNFWVADECSPDNEGYQRVQDWAEITGVDDSNIQAASDAGQRIAAEIGLENMKIAMCAGQQCSENGLFFIGGGYSWSRVVFENTLYRELKRARQAVYLDLHTGLGPTGFADLLVTYSAGDWQLELLAHYLDDRVRGHARDTATDQHTPGSTETGVNRCYQQFGVAGITVTAECGTLPLDQVLDALRLEQAMHAYGDSQHPRFTEIKQLLRDAFYVDTPEWQSQVLEQTLGFFNGAVNCLHRETFPVSTDSD